MKPVWVAAIVLILGTSCGVSGGAGSDSGSGVSGQTLIGPTCPVEQSTSSCPDRGVSAQVKLVDSAGSTVGETTSSDDGSFSIQAAPGDYSVVAEVTSGLPTPQSRQVDATVSTGSYTDVVITFDSGIRGPASP